jgi:DNA repair protein RecN (Recombination protein N)
MISHLLIKDFATIEDLEVDFHRGLNVITGETGAGKSVVISAMSMVLGARADSTFVRSGCEKASIQMLIDKDNKETLLTREIQSNGKSICKIDGQIVTLGELRKFAEKAADIHGQYEHQYLLDTSNHIKLIDKYDSGAISQAKEKVSDLYNEYMLTRKKLEELEDMTRDNDQRKELIRFEIKEIRDAAMTSGEDIKLQEEIEELQHMEEIYDALSNAYGDARENNVNALDALSTVIQDLKQVNTISKDASFFEDEISDLYYRLEDVCNRLREARDTSTTSPGAIDELSDRLYEVNRLKSKYGQTIDSINQYADDQERVLHSLVSLDTEIESTALELKTKEEMLKTETEHLSILRRNSAKGLEEKIQNELLKLNFENVVVSVKITKSDTYHPDGIDDMEFMISTNAGEDIKPLAKIVSGGEMSRIMLAFKMIMAEFDGIPTMIFDEIDTGISGETAIVIGRTIKDLARNHQVITITHLPQITAFGEHNYRIEKSSDDSNTYTTMRKLTEEEKTAEIARLIAGLNITDLTLQSAMEMIKLTNNE